MRLRQFQKFKMDSVLYIETYAMFYFLYFLFFKQPAILEKNPVFITVVILTKKGYNWNLFPLQW